jgi:CAI-1 autoinducer synthase
MAPDIDAFDRLQELAQPYPFQHPENVTDYVCLHENDYLRLSERPEVRDAKIQAVASGKDAFLGSSVFRTGDAENPHDTFSSLVAKSMQCEDVLLTTSGWTANVGLIEAIAKPGIPVYLDQKVHASCWDGARLSAGNPVMLRHNDPNFLESRIRRFGPGIVCIDSFYSTNGAVCDLAAYVEICERSGCTLVLDEAHSFGMIGHGSGGLAVQLGLADRVPFRTTSFSKALGGHGGCIATSRKMGWYLRHWTRSMIFSSTPQASDSAAHQAALEIARSEPWLAAHVQSMAELMRANLRELGVRKLSSASQILSFDFPSIPETCRAYGLLRDRGVLASVFTPPATPTNKGLVRFSLHTRLYPADVVRASRAIADVLDELGRLSDSEVDR